MKPSIGRIVTVLGGNPSESSYLQIVTKADRTPKRGASEECCEGRMTAPGKPKRPAPDWEKAKALYRTGTVSIREIARQCGCSAPAVLKRAAKEEWKRDLAEQVRQAVKDKLVTTEAAAVNNVNARSEPLTDAETVSAAAESAVEVVRSHRRDLTAGANTINLLFSQLQDAAANREQFETLAAEIAEEQGGNSAVKAQKLARLHKAISLPAHAAIARDLSTAMKNFQALERIAWNLNDKQQSDGWNYEAELAGLKKS